MNAATPFFISFHEINQFFLKRWTVKKCCEVLWIQIIFQAIFKVKKLKNAVETRSNEFGSMTAGKDDKIPSKSIFCHKTAIKGYTVQDHKMPYNTISLHWHTLA